MSGTVGDNTVRVSGVVASAAGGGAFTYLASATASDSSSLDITTGIDSTYDVYLCTWSNIHPGTDGSYFWVRMEVGGSFVSSSDYRYGSFWMSSSGSYPGGNHLSNSATHIVTTYNGTSDAAAEPKSGYLYLFNPSSTSMWKNMIWKETGMQHDGYLYSTNGSGLLEKTEAVTGLQFLFSSAGTIASGTVRLYGLANS